MRGLAVIPAFNEAERVRQVIEGVKAHFAPQDILLVDDGSADCTASVAEAAGVRVMRLGKNMGKGYALRQGFSEAIREGYDFVIILDADGQHPPERIPLFIKAAEHADIVIGSRRPFIGMPRANYFSNRITTLAISLMTRTRIADSQSGFRLVKTRLLRSVSLRTSRYQTESELLVKALWRGFRLAHVPVDVIYRGERSHIKGWLDVPRAIILAVWLMIIKA
ncbi:MAG: glycosyltransferase family 2 protein [candidate division WOR-3 bacterium]